MVICVSMYLRSSADSSERSIMIDISVDGLKRITEPVGSDWAVRSFATNELNSKVQFRNLLGDVEIRIECEGRKANKTCSQVDLPCQMECGSVSCVVRSTETVH